MAVTLLGLGPAARDIQAQPLTDSTPKAGVAAPADRAATDRADGGVPAEVDRCVFAPYAGCVEADLRDQALLGVNLTGANLTRALLDGASASGATLAEASLVMASMVGTVLESADLRRANVTNADLTRASLRGADAEGLDASRAGMREADLSGANLVDAVLQQADLRGANLTGANLTGADLTGALWTDGQQCQSGSIGRCIPGQSTDPVDCVIGPQAQCPKADLTKAALRKVNLTSANLIEARLDGVDATEAVLSYADLVMASLVAVTLDRATLTQTDLTSAVLTAASARGVSARGLDAAWADLSDTDFSGSDLTDAFLGAVRATATDFSGATLVGVNFSAANLARADLRGVDLTNALLRNADLQGAKLAKAVLIGADLSGATWIDGRTCAEGSVGACRAETAVQDEIENPPGSALAVMSVISFAVTISRLISDCSSNLPNTGSCFNAGTREQLNSIRLGISEIQKQMEANQKEVRDALNIIIANQKDAKVEAAFRAVQSDMYFTSLALLKYSELVDCIAALDQKKPTCTLTNYDGTLTSTFQLTSTDDLYVGANIPATGAPEDWKPLESMQYGGPVARVLFATLYRFGGGGAYTQSALTDRGRAMQMAIAGSSERPQDGLLAATVEYLNATLAVEQGARAGTSPAFIPGTYMVRTNRFTQHYVQAQISFYGPAIAALMLVARQPEAKPQGVLDLQALAEKGGYRNPQWALPVQLDTYSFDLDRYGIDITTRTDGPAVNDSPERVGFVIGTNGKVYRVQTVYGVASRAYVYPNFDFPTYGALENIQRGIDRTGVVIGTLQRAYPATFPGGTPAAWYASYGTSYKVVQAGDPRRTNTTKPDYVYDRYTTFTVPDQAPQAIKWGNNVVWARHSSPCIVPVRMWNKKPTFADQAEADGWRNQPGKQLMVARSADAGYRRMDKNFVITFDAPAAYDAVVSTGAAPAFDLNRYEVKITAERGREGTGILWRCGGGENSLAGTRPAPASFVSVRTVEPEGLLTRLVAAAR